MAQLRIRAFMIGYSIYYGGIYTKYATIYSCYQNAVSDKSFKVDMTDTIKGLKEIEEILKGLN